MTGPSRRRALYAFALVEFRAISMGLRHENSPTGGTTVESYFRSLEDQGSLRTAGRSKAVPDRTRRLDDEKLVQQLELQPKKEQRQEHH